MNPAPGLLNDWITIPGFLWLILGCIVATYLAIFTIQLVRVWDENDAANEAAQQDDQLAQDVLDYHCAGHGHDYLACDGHWFCAHCSDVVRQPLNCGGHHRYETRGQSQTCTVCGFRTALPYDQEASA